MATTVTIAFEEFMRDVVRLEKKQTEKAISSRDNLISNINNFSGDDDFFSLNTSKHLKFGSFARHTKIRPLDDIDLMICISAEGRKYTKSGDAYYINSIKNDYYNGLTSGINDNYLNSTKVINRFIKKLGIINDYKKAEMHKNHEAATLQLNSYTWNFDIVPCFYLDGDNYLIPDGLGNWKMTAPGVDNQRIQNINQVHNGKLLDIIRIMKFWNSRSITYTIDSYLLECMILEEYKNIAQKDNYWIDIEFRDLLKNLSNSVYHEIKDPKGIQGNLNTLSYDAKRKISDALNSAYLKAKAATELEITNNDQKGAIIKWGEVLGNRFPNYS